MQHRQELRHSQPGMRIAIVNTQERYFLERNRIEAIAKRQHQQEISLANEQYDQAVQATATAIFNNISDFTTLLQAATSSYQHQIQDKFFRGAGRKKALNLQNDLLGAKDTAAVFKAFHTAIEVGKENADSLKTILYRAIAQRFCPDMAVLLKSANTLMRGSTDFLHAVLVKLTDLSKMPELKSGIQPGV